MRKLKTLALLIAFSLIIVVPVIAAPLISLNPIDMDLLNDEGQIEILVGTTFDVGIYFSGLSDFAFSPAKGLVAMNLGLNWGPLVDFVSFTGGVTWGSLDKIPGDEGVVLNGFQFGTPIDFDHLIGTFTFSCTGEGLVDLIPYGVVPNSSFALDDWSQLDPYVEFQSITVNQAVPIPPALLLFGSGILGMLGIRRKFNK